MGEQAFSSKNKEETKQNKQKKQTKTNKEGLVPSEVTRAKNTDKESKNKKSKETKKYKKGAVQLLVKCFQCFFLGGSKKTFFDNLAQKARVLKKHYNNRGCNKQISEKHLDKETNLKSSYIFSFLFSLNSKTQKMLKPHL